MPWLAVLGLTIWLAIMGLSIALSLAPITSLKLTQRFICPPGTKLEVETFEITDHHGKRKGLIVRRVGQGQSKDMKTKAIIVLWALFLIPSLPISILVVWLIPLI
jgi:hypothetical protein